MLTDGDLLELHRTMLEEQRKGEDFDLTFRELMEIWHVSSTSMVNYYMGQLLERGLVKAKQHGKTRIYRAVEV